MLAILFFLIPIFNFTEVFGGPRVEGVSGKVDLIRGSKILPVSGETTLQAKDLLRTHRQGRATMTAKNGVIQLAPFSLLEVTEFSKDGGLLKGKLLHGNFEVKASGGELKIAAMITKISASTQFFVHIFKSNADFNKSMGDLSFEMPTLGEVLGFPQAKETWVQISCLEGSPLIQDLQLQPEEMIRSQGGALDPVAKRVGREAILTSVSGLNF